MREKRREKTIVNNYTIHATCKTRDYVGRRDDAAFRRVELLPVVSVGRVT